MPRTARQAAIVAILGILTTLLPLVTAAPASAARQKSIRIADTSVVEGDSGKQAITFTLTWTGAKGGSAVSVDYATANGSATAGSDYTPKTGTATFNNGCRCASVSIDVLGDTTSEGTETFVVDLSNPVSATIADLQAVGTIYDNEGPPAFVVTDASAAENAGTISFDVLMTNASASTQSVNFTTVDNTALAGPDYTAKSGTLTFTSGQTSKSVAVSLTNDVMNEADETFDLVLTTATLSLDDASAVGTILNDDPEPTLAVSDASAAEGGGSIVFTITSSAASGQEVDVDYATTDGTAAAGTDYSSTTGTAVIPAGSTTTTVSVPVADDTIYEGDETFTLDLSSEYNATIWDAQALGTITDDDGLPGASIGDASVLEGDTGTGTATFAITLTHASAFASSADWTTADGTATAGTDYAASSGTVSFAAGVTTAHIDVTVNGDVAKETDETFSVSLSNPSGLTIPGASGTGTITDDDRGDTALTLKVIATRAKVGAKGLLERATADASVTVTLFKRKHKVWVQVGTPRTVTVTKLGDRDGDGKPDATYRATAKRPAKGSYKLTAAFAGNATLLPSAKSATFKL